MLSFHVVNKKRVKEGASNSGPRFINFFVKRQAPANEA